MQEKLPISDSLSQKAAEELIRLWGINDWRESTAYPNSRAINNEMWRWEFLRRDAKYREIWSAWDKGWGQTATIDELISFGLRDFFDPRISYKGLVKKRPHIFQQYPAVLEGGEVYWEYTDTDDNLEKDIQSTLNYADGFIDIRIDLKRPIAPQMESVAIRKILWERQKKLVGKILRHRVSDDPVLYLRAIDALLVGAKNTTIGQHIFGCTTKSSQAARGRQVEIQIHKMWKKF